MEDFPVKNMPNLRRCGTLYGTTNICVFSWLEVTFPLWRDEGPPRSLYPPRDGGRSCKLQSRLGRDFWRESDFEDTMIGSIYALGAMFGCIDSQYGCYCDVAPFRCNSRSMDGIPSSPFVGKDPPVMCELSE